MTTGSSMQAMTFAVPPQIRHFSTSISPKAPTLGENPLQALGPGYCQGWHVCRFCRSKNRSSPHDVELAFSHPGHLLLWACCLLPALPVSPALGVCYSGRIHRGIVSRLTLGFGTRAANRTEKAAAQAGNLTLHLPLLTPGTV
jgi:hypothetical protein